MNEFFSFAFIQRGLAAAVITGASCSLLGVFVVLRGMSYIGTGIAHGCLAGVALSFLIGWNPLTLSVITALLMVLLVETVGHKAALKVDASIGVVFSVAMALAVLFIGMIGRYTPDIMSYLFGNLLAVTPSELKFMSGIGLVVCAVIVFLFKELQFSTYDAEMAEISGIPAGFISILLSVILGLTIVISLRAVGELLVIALMVLPASAAYQLAKSLKTMAVLSVSVGVFAAVAGLVVSFRLNTPTGSTIVLILALIFMFSVIIKRVIRKQPRQA